MATLKSSMIYRFIDGFSLINHPFSGNPIPPRSPAGTWRMAGCFALRNSKKSDKVLTWRVINGYQWGYDGISMGIFSAQDQP